MDDTPGTQPIITVHLNAREQFFALAVSSHVHCGAKSLARGVTSRPVLLRYLWDLLFSPPPTIAFGVVVSALMSTAEAVRSKIMSFSVSSTLGGVLTEPPVYVSIVWQDNTEDFGFTCVRDLSGSQLWVVEKLRVKAQQATVYWKRLITSRDHVMRFLEHIESMDSVNAVSSKWLIHGDLGRAGLEVRSLFTLEDSAKTLGIPDGGPGTLESVPPERMFFNRNNWDEAVVVTQGYVFVVIDVAQSFNDGVAKVLSETRWNKSSSFGDMEKVLVFNMKKKGSGSQRRFIVLVESWEDFGFALFYVDEGTGTSEKICAQYELWDVNNTENPLWSFPLGNARIVTAECGFLFRCTEGGAVVEVTQASTGNLVVSLSHLPPKNTTSISGFVF
ncbi:hypothetical protein Pelo_14789 [Pelomyxa schiedti]|nr:hypothetical protein Pelo_14789 [Pelomyxa schiedti]